MAEIVLRIELPDNSAKIQEFVDQVDDLARVFGGDAWGYERVMHQTNE